MVILRTETQMEMDNKEEQVPIAMKEDTEENTWIGGCDFNNYY